MAIVVVVLVEWLKRPRLDIKGSVWTPKEPVRWAFAAVEVYNKPLPRLLGALLLRSSANDCQVRLEYREPGKKHLALPSVVGIWSSQPRPERLMLVTGEGEPSAVREYDESMIPVSTRLDIPASAHGQEVCIAVLRADGTANAFGAESYRHENWKHPDWELAREIYEVTVRVQASGVAASGRFTLNNLATDFATFIRIERA